MNPAAKDLRGYVVDVEHNQVIIYHTACSTLVTARSLDDDVDMADLADAALCHAPECITGGGR